MFFLLAAILSVQSVYAEPVVNTQRAAASLFSFLMSYGRRSTLIDMEEGSFIFRTMTL